MPLVEDIASDSSGDLHVDDGPRRVIAWRDFQARPRAATRPRRVAAWFPGATRRLISLTALFALLAVAATIPVVNVVALGYLMESQGRVARSGQFRSAFNLLPAAQRLCGMILAVWLWLLPIQFLSELARDSWLLAPGGRAAWLWTSLLVVVSSLIAVHLLMAIGCGGGFWRFLRPLSNARTLLPRVRTGAFWQDAHHAISEFVSAFRLSHLLQQGLLAYVATYFWLVVPTLLFTTLDDVTSRWQIVCFIVGCASLTLMLLWVPLLLAHVAAESRWQAMFEFSTVRRLAGRTPFRWAFATALLLGCSVLPLLYTALVKNRIPAHDARWDLMLVALVTVVPARILIGWVYHRATQTTHASSWLWQWTNGAALCFGVGWYVYFLHLAQTGGELGQRSVWQYHAMLLPLPF